MSSGNGANGTEDAQRATIVEDGNAEQKADQKEINELARRVAEKRLGRRYTPGDKSYGPMVRDVMFDHKQRCGIPHKKPKDYTLADVASLKASLLEELEG